MKQWATDESNYGDCQKHQQETLRSCYCPDSHNPKNKKISSKNISTINKERLENMPDGRKDKEFSEIYLINDLVIEWMWMETMILTEKDYQISLMILMWYCFVWYSQLWKDWKSNKRKNTVNCERPSKTLEGRKTSELRLSSKNNNVFKKRGNEKKKIKDLKDQKKHLILIMSILLIENLEKRKGEWIEWLMKQTNLWWNLHLILID